MGPHVTQQGLQLEVDLPMTSQLAPNHLAAPVLLVVIPSRDESVNHGSFLSGAIKRKLKINERRSKKNLKRYAIPFISFSKKKKIAEDSKLRRCV